MENQLQVEHDIQHKPNFTKLAPSKFTYLNSNELITKFLKEGTVKENISKLQTSANSPNAYALCETQKVQLQEKTKEILAKTIKVLNQAKKTSYETEIKKQKQDKQLQNQAKKLDLYIQTMHGKSGDIMCGRNNSHYTRREVQADEQPLNQLKSNTCDRSRKKVEATRKTMIKKCQKIVETMPYNSQKSLQVSILSDSFGSYTSSTLLSNSLASTERSKKQSQNNQIQKFKQMIQKSQSYENLMQMERRKTVAQGFGMWWKLGAQDKKMNKPGLFNCQKTSRSRHAKGKADSKMSYLQQISQTQKCDMAVGRKYNEAFEKVLQNFELKQVI